MNERERRQAIRDHQADLQRGWSLIGRSVVLTATDPPSAVLLRVGPTFCSGFRNRRYRLWFDERYDLSGEVVIRVGYRYVLENRDSQEVLAWHLHPASFAEPHLHLGVAAGDIREELARAHIPTSVVALPTYLRFLIRDFAVKPVRRDWEAVLASTERP